MTSSASFKRKFESWTTSRLAAQVVIGSFWTAPLVAFVWPAGANVASFIFIGLGWILVLRESRLWTHPLILLSALSIGYVLFSGALATFSNIPGNHFGHVGKHLLVPFGCAAGVALTMARQRLRLSLSTIVFQFIAALMSGALVMLLINSDFNQAWQSPLSTSIPVFNELNRNFAAFATGTAVLGIVIISPKLASSAATHSRLAAIAVLILSSATLFWLSVLLFRFQSRAAVLAIAVGLVFFFVKSIAVRRRVGSGEALLATVGIVASIAGVILYGPLIAQRFASSTPLDQYVLVLKAILTGRSNDVAEILKGMEERWHLIAMGSNLIFERPLFGWGPDLTRVARSHPIPGVYTVPQPQFHNGYLHELVSSGFVGIAIFMALLVAVLRDFKSASDDFTNGPSRRAVLTATAPLVAYLLVINFTESVFMVRAYATAAIMFIALVTTMGGLGQAAGISIVERDNDTKLK